VSKKGKKGRSIALPRGLAGAMLAHVLRERQQAGEPPMITEFADRLSRDAELTTRAWPINSAANHLVGSEGFIVTVPSRSMVAELLRQLRDTEPFLTIFACDFLHDEQSVVILDTESAKQMVNVMGEAIALAEQVHADALASVRQKEEPRDEPAKPRASG
jgi:hypothetical protein